MRMNFWKVSTFALLAALVTTHAVPLASADKQPLMRGALVNMKKAHVQLKKATHDKGWSPGQGHPAPRGVDGRGRGRHQVRQPELSPRVGRAAGGVGL
jgi:hypothetical protein